jgi:DNA-binding response OmpR family regulator
MQIKVLIVEDEAIVSEDLKDRLHQAGYIVSGIQTSAQTVLDEIQKSSPNLVLWDVKFKDEAIALDLAKKISSNFKIPLIYITTMNGNGSLDGIRFVSKPIDDRELMAAIEGLCRTQTL